jgi:hypothetical protein
LLLADFALTLPASTCSAASTTLGAAFANLATLLAFFAAFFTVFFAAFFTVFAFLGLPFLALTAFLVCAALIFLLGFGSAFFMGRDFNFLMLRTTLTVPASLMVTATPGLPDATSKLVLCVGQQLLGKVPMFLACPDTQPDRTQKGPTLLALRPLYPLTPLYDDDCTALASFTFFVL